MGRPKTVNIKTFPTYDKLHTKKVKMYAGVEITALYPIKETAQFYLSPEVWSYCCSKFKVKKKNLPKLSVDIPTITDQKTIDFLEEHAWHDWVGKERTGNKKDEMEETIALLNNLFPDKKKVFFYELDSIISAYNNGTFVKYDDEGNIKQATDNDIKNRKYYTHKYHRYDGLKIPEIKTAYDAYRTYSDNNSRDEEQTRLYGIYHDLEQDYIYQNFNLDNVFLEIGNNTVCYPVAFSDNTAEWSKEKYGKLIGYAHAGEIYFVVTPDAVYFEVKRHY